MTKNEETISLTYTVFFFSTKIAMQYGAEMYMKKKRVICIEHFDMYLIHEFMRIYL